MERRLEVTEAMGIRFEDAAAVLAEDPGSVLAPVDTPRSTDDRHWTVELEASLGTDSGLTQRAVISLGREQRGEDALRLPLRWQPTSHTRLLPSFQGTLELARRGEVADLSLRGSYRAPLGPVGAFGDGVMGHRLARRTITALLREVVERTTVEVARRAAENRDGASKAVDDHPERWLG